MPYPNSFPSNPRGKILRGLIALLTAGSLAAFGYVALRAGKSIFDLLNQNRELRSAISHLTQVDQIGFAKVLAEEVRDGVTYRQILFVETDRNDPTERILERTYELPGEEIFFDALIVKFGPRLVMSGDEKALYLWRRVYSEKIPPEQGFPIEIAGEVPERYADISRKLSIRDREMFWREIWELANDPNRLADAGITAINGHAVYQNLRPGVIYVFKIGAGGDPFIETVPDL
jgi:hypothetical protein